jgi:hypothetical protein
MRTPTLFSMLALAMLTVLFLGSCGTPTTTISPTQEETAPCAESDTSTLGILRSTDHGATWTDLGDACIQGLTILPADPTSVVVGSHIILFFVDFSHLFQEVTQSLYRAESIDGIHFDTPKAVYSQEYTMVDPSVRLMVDNTWRLYVPSDQEGLISAISSDGFTFTREPGAFSLEGGMPGALQLSDGRVRLFLASDGILSYISSDGLNFTRESGLRIPAETGTMVDNPEPIQLEDGTYLMLFSSHNKSDSGKPEPWTFTQIRLATSTDGLDWSINPTVIGYGGTSCVIETEDGTLLIYYGH